MNNEGTQQRKQGILEAYAIFQADPNRLNSICVLHEPWDLQIKPPLSCRAQAIKAFRIAPTKPKILSGLDSTWRQQIKAPFFVLGGDLSKQPNQDNQAPNQYKLRYKCLRIHNIWGKSDWNPRNASASVVGIKLRRNQAKATSMSPPRSNLHKPGLGWFQQGKHGWGSKEWQAKNNSMWIYNHVMWTLHMNYIYQCSSKSHAQVESLHRNWRRCRWPVLFHEGHWFPNTILNFPLCKTLLITTLGDARRLNLAKPYAHPTDLPPVADGLVIFPGKTQATEDVHISSNWTHLNTNQSESKFRTIIFIEKDTSE